MSLELRPGINQEGNAIDTRSPVGKAQPQPRRLWLEVNQVRGEWLPVGVATATSLRYSQGQQLCLDKPG